MALAIGLKTAAEIEAFEAWARDGYEERKREFDRQCAQAQAAKMRELQQSDPLHVLSPELKMAELRQARSDRRAELLEAALAHSAAVARQVEQQEREAEALAAVRSYFVEEAA